MTDIDRARAIGEDWWLTEWWRKSGQSKRAFISDNRDDLTAYITDPVAFLERKP